MKYEDLEGKSVEVKFPGSEPFGAEVWVRGRLNDFAVVLRSDDCEEYGIYMSVDGETWQSDGQIVEIEKPGEFTRRAIKIVPDTETGASYSLNAEGIKRLKVEDIDENAAWILRVMNHVLNPERPWVDEPILRARLNLAFALRKPRPIGPMLGEDIDPWKAFCFYKGQLIGLGILLMRMP